MNIKLKDIVLKYEFDDSIVLRFNSELINIEDNEGDIRYLFSLLDGSFNEKQILDKFIDKYPSKKEVFSDYMNTLKDMAVIEYEHQNCFDDYKSSRWSRNFDFYDSLSKFGESKFNFQKKIFDAKVCLLGCGGLGSHILYELAAVGFLNITIVDFDKIELSNLNRQILYKESDIGKSKVFTAQENIKKFTPNAHIDAIERRINSADDIANIIRGHNLVICVADKPRDKMVDWLNEACVRENIPYINGGLNLSRASFYSVIPKKTGCAECWRKSVANTIQDRILEIDIEKSVDYQKPAPALSALVSVAAGVMVTEVVKIVTNISAPSLVNNLKAFNFSTSEIKTVEKWNLNKDCCICGN